MQTLVKIVMAALGLILVYLIVANGTTSQGLLSTSTSFLSTETKALQGR